MPLHKLWKRFKNWGASSWKRAKHIGKQGLNKTAELYNQFDNYTGGKAASTIGQGVATLASLHPGAAVAAQIAGFGLNKIGGLLSDGNKWKQHLQNLGKGLNFEQGSNTTSNDTPPTAPIVKKKQGGNSGGNMFVHNGRNRLM